MKAYNVFSICGLLTLVAYPSCNNDDETDKPVVYLSCPDNNHPHMIDLGLPSGTMWACCNVDATAPEKFGGHYAWGETNEKADYRAESYQYCTGQDNNGDGRYDEEPQFQHIGDDIAGSEYDVAHVKWGKSWRMPTLDQIIELVDKCSWKWTSQNDVNGIAVSGKNGGSIFLPAADCRRNDIPTHEDLCGYYWSSTLINFDEYDANYLIFDSQSWAYRHYARTYRYFGYSVRPVCQTNR